MRARGGSDLTTNARMHACPHLECGLWGKAGKVGVAVVEGAKTTRVAFRTGKMRPPAFNCDTAKKFHIPSTVFPILLFPPSRRIHSFVPDYQRRHCPLSRFLAQQEGRALSALSVLLFRLYLTFCSFTFGGSGSGATATDRQYTSCFLKQYVRRTPTFGTRVDSDSSGSSGKVSY